MLSRSDYKELDVPRMSMTQGKCWKNVVLTKEFYHCFEFYQKLGRFKKYLYYLHKSHKT